ncbi:hypothetical protein [Streptomyces sp. NPDC001880]
MRVTMILPALTEATSPLFRPIKYSLFPPLGLATLAGYLDPDDEVTLLDEHVERVDIEAGFVFGLDHDGPDVFDRTVEWPSSRASRRPPSTS